MFGRSFRNVLWSSTQLSHKPQADHVPPDTHRLHTSRNSTSSSAPLKRSSRLPNVAWAVARAARGAARGHNLVACQAALQLNWSGQLRRKYGNQGECYGQWDGLGSTETRCIYQKGGEAAKNKPPDRGRSTRQCLGSRSTMLTA
eukprot:906856-Pelagomonas_calceolata.AAC.3